MENKETGNMRGWAQGNPQSVVTEEVQDYSKHSVFSRKMLVPEHIDNWKCMR